MLNPDFAATIANATRAVIPDATDAQIKVVTSGVLADPVWAALSWMDAATAEGALAQGLAEKATVLAKAVSAATSNLQPNQPATDEAQVIRAAFDLSDDAWRKLPPEDKLRLRAGLAEKQAEKEAAKSNADALKAKAADGTITPTERLTLARLTEEAPTKEQRRDPRFVQAQRERASTAELEKMIRGHEQVYASAAYPQVMRDDHRRHADRLRAIIREREAADA